MTNFEKVGIFMKTFGQDVKTTSELAEDKINKLRVSLIEEELDELKAAIKDNDIKEVADALTDILYVTYGAGHAFGINLDKCFEEVQNSNMSKLGSDGKPIYNDLGSEVCVFEMQDRICPNEDHDISVRLEKILTKKGIKFFKDSIVEDVSKRKDIQLISNNKAFPFDKVLIAIGGEGNTDKLGLENTLVKVKNKQIITYDFGMTDEKNIYAIGDVAGLPWLAHKASHEGIKCVEYIAKLNTNFKNSSQIIPSCIYSSPQVASIGLTEQKAKSLNKVIKIGKFPLSANGKALALGEGEGFIKTLFDAKTGEILGAHMIGPEVTELINTFSLAMKLEATEADIMSTVFPHPTLSEAIHESTLDAFNEAIHI